MQLMILGMHRSGTSVLARMLNLMGVYFGPEGMSTGANKENPKGFWERRDVRGLNDMVLHSTGCDWDRVLEFDIAKVPESVMAEFDKRAARLILEMDSHRPWFLKEPRLCLLLPLWLKFLEVPVCLHIVRHPVEVASSLRTRNGIPIEAGLVLWDRYVGNALQASAHLPSLIVSHRDLIQNPKAAASRLLADLRAMDIQDLRMPTEREVRSFIRDDLYRERETRPDLVQYANAPQVGFFESLATGKLSGMPTINSLSAAGWKTLNQYETSLPPLEPSELSWQSMLEPELDLREQLVIKSREAQSLRELSDRTSAQLSATVDACNAAEASVSERFREIELLTRQLMDQESATRKAETNAGSLGARLEQAEARTRDLEQAAAQVDRLRREREGLHRQNGQLTLRAASQRQRTEALELQLKEMGNSVAWRIGAPIRKLRRMVGRSNGASAPANDVATIRQSELFDARWYVEHYPDVLESSMDPAQHYLEHGACEGRNPGPRFDTGSYLSCHADVAESGQNPLVHFILHGKSEGRSMGRERNG